MKQSGIIPISIFGALVTVAGTLMLLTAGGQEKSNIANSFLAAKAHVSVTANKQLEKADADTDADANTETLLKPRRPVPPAKSVSAFQAEEFQAIAPTDIAGFEQFKRKTIALYQQNPRATEAAFHQYLKTGRNLSLALVLFYADILIDHSPAPAKTTLGLLTVAKAGMQKKQFWHDHANISDPAKLGILAANIVEKAGKSQRITVAVDLENELLELFETANDPLIIRNTILTLKTKLNYDNTRIKALLKNRDPREGFAYNDILNSDS